MNAPEQLTFLEPTGAEVPELCRKALAEADRADYAAELLDKRGLFASAAHYRRTAAAERENAACFEMLAMLERWAGLS